tara:strand:+ start:361 stop:552 length:192 start_codon:yes stop_codon:yes gene_type:complete
MTTDLKDISSTLENIEYAIDTKDALGGDDVYGNTANTNLANIASNLYEINDTLKQILKKLENK